MAKDKRPKTASNTGYGILNPYGDMWTSEVFSTEGQARGHLERFWRTVPGGSDLSKYKIVRARQVAHYVGDIQ
ncbi:hypothetical protein V1290_000082 [Bradyrhizobium sp. AZCC 1578]|uniref:hypothetical protein n=1 Tax=Bradyrhizobium sp. AZCC 1578 TaxID=3117027 RepID=UPI002FF0E1C6